ITFDDASFVFDGSEKSIEITGTLPAGTSVSYADNSRTNVGTQQATATITGSNFQTLVLTADLEITPATLEVSPNPNQSKIYGEQDPILTFSASGFASGDDEGILTGSIGRDVGENVGSFAIQQGSLDAGVNYTINFTPSDFQINPANLEVRVEEGQSKVFGTDDPEFAFTATGFVAGDDQQVFSGKLSRTAGEGVGNYPINIGDLTAGANYDIEFRGSEFEILA
ncbi:hypothetical protein MM236_19620, partial [Belliella sp. DSM 107340]